MSSLITQCLSFSLLLAANTLSNIVIPFSYDIDLGNSTVITLKDLQCPTVAGGKTGVYYNSTGISIEVFEAMNITCEMEIDINHERSTTLVFGLTSKAGEAMTVVTEEDSEKPCYPSNATLSTCTLAPEISNLRFEPDAADLNGILSIITSWIINPKISEAICGLGKDVATQLMNTTTLPLSPAPALKVGALPVQEWPVLEMISTIVASLPRTLFGAHIDVTDPSTTSLELNVTMEKAINISTETFSFYAPANVLLSADVGFDMLVCSDDGWRCAISNGIRVPGIRTWGGGQMDRLMNNYLSPLISELVAKFTSAGIKLNIPNEDAIETPPLLVVILFGPLLAIMAVSAVGYSVYRHSKNPILDIHGKAISTGRVILEDIFVTGMCFTCIYLFAWSNATTAASVVVGDELTVYTFSLVNSVEDMWKAGLYPLSILICIFSGIYPYVKLLSIVTFSVILQQPQNKILRLVDTIGKYSLLDSFVMTILKTGLEINGIASVKSHLSFYVFVIATLGSMFIGNYATHGWRRQTQIRYNDTEREMMIQRSSVNSRLSKSASSPIPEHSKKLLSPSSSATPHIGIGINSPSSGFGGAPYGGAMSGDADDAFRKQKGGTKFDSAIRRHLISDKGLEGIEALSALRWYDIWEWQLAVPLGIILAVISGIACYYPSITYSISGFAVVLTGKDKPCSLWDLFIACDPLLLVVGLFTVVFAPITYVATYPHCRFLAAWGATDVFLLSCVAGLLQLKQFINFTLGEGMEGIYTADCALQWPLALWAVSVFVQWFFTFKQTMGIPGIPTLTKIRLALAIRDGDSSVGDDEGN